MSRLAVDHRSSALKAGRFKKSLSLPLETLGRDKKQHSLLRSFATMRCSQIDPAVNHGSGQGGDHHTDCDIIDDPVHTSIPRADHGERLDCSVTGTGTSPPTTIDCSFTTGTGTSPPTTISPRQAAPSLALANTPVAPVVRGTPSVSIEDSPAPSLPKASVHEGNQNRSFRRSVSSGGSPASIFSKASVAEGNQHKGFRREYKLGDKGRSSDMITEPTDEQAFEAVASLENFDFAFLKRSNGSFSYAILAYRSMEPITRDNRTSLVECMNFITCDGGSTKKVPKNRWGEYVRRVSKEGVSPKKTVEEVLSPQYPHVGWFSKEGVSPKNPREPPVRHDSKEVVSPEMEEALRPKDAPPICEITCILHLEDESTISIMSEPDVPLSGKWPSLGKGHSRTKGNCSARRTEKKSEEKAPCPRRSIRKFVRWNSK